MMETKTHLQLEGAMCGLPEVVQRRSLESHRVFGNITACVILAQLG